MFRDKPLSDKRTTDWQLPKECHWAQQEATLVKLPLCNTKTSHSNSKRSFQWFWNDFNFIAIIVNCDKGKMLQLKNILDKMIFAVDDT